MRKITSEQGQQIIDMACPTWQEHLAIKWGKDIVRKRLIEITNDDYQTMREACTKEQNVLFDQIFGSDIHPFKVGDYFTVVKDYWGLNGVVGKTYKITRIVGDSLFYEEKNSVCSRKVEVRPATPEEICKYNTIPKGTPCFVRDGKGISWSLYYADGNGRFYINGLQYSTRTIPWNYFHEVSKGLPEE